MGVERGTIRQKPSGRTPGRTQETAQERVAYPRFTRGVEIAATVSARRSRLALACLHARTPGASSPMDDLASASATPAERARRVERARVSAYLARVTGRYPDGRGRRRRRRREMEPARVHPCVPPRHRPLPAVRTTLNSMAIRLDHTIVPAIDGEYSARWFSRVFDLADPVRFSVFWQVSTDNGVDLDFDMGGSRTSRERDDQSSRRRPRRLLRKSRRSPLRDHHGAVRRRVIDRP